MTNSKILAMLWRNETISSLYGGDIAQKKRKKRVMGSGTTTYVSKILDRCYMGSEISSDYFKLADAKITDE